MSSCFATATFSFKTNGGTTTFGFFSGKVANCKGAGGTPGLTFIFGANSTNMSMSEHFMIVSNCTGARNTASNAASIPTNGNNCLVGLGLDALGGKRNVLISASPAVPRKIAPRPNNRRSLRSRGIGIVIHIRMRT